jgi:hypothetical protein
MTEKNVQAGTERVQGSRRDFLKGAAYVTPAILTLAVAPSYAKAGSEKEDRRARRRERLEDLLEWLRQLR